MQAEEKETPCTSCGEPTLTSGCSSTHRSDTHPTWGGVGQLLSARCSPWRNTRTQQWQDRGLLLFWPWFVEAAFQQHYASTVLLCDSLCLPLDVVIWSLCALSMHNIWELVLTALLPLAFSVACWAHKQLHPEQYMRRRAVLTSIRRLTILPSLSCVLLRRPVHATSSWQAAFIHTFVLSGSMHAMVATFYFLNSRWVRGVFEIAVAAVVLWTAAPSACQNILAGPHSEAGWQVTAALMDRAAFNIYRGSVNDAPMAHAVCCTTLNTTLVVCSCLAAYMLHWFERTQRLQFKARVPPAVAAMQAHVYGLPTPLVAAQGLLLLLYPAMVLGWMLLGAARGL